MKAVIQRVERAEVAAGGETAGAIGRGLLVFLGVARGDGEAVADYSSGQDREPPHLRGRRREKENETLSLLDAGGELLVISQFTIACGLPEGKVGPPSSTPGEPEAGPPALRSFLRRRRGTPAGPGGRGLRVPGDDEGDPDGTTACDHYSGNAKRKGETP